MCSPWLIHVNVWQKPLQYFKVISLQLININEKIKYLQGTGCLKVIEQVKKELLKTKNMILKLKIQWMYWAADQTEEKI